MPKLLTTHIVLNSFNMLNFFPKKRGNSDNLSLKTIMSGKHLNYKNHPPIKLGHYGQVNEEENTRTSQVTRTKGSIFLGPIGNLQGRYKFMALKTANKIVRRSWYLIPMTDAVIS